MLKGLVKLHICLNDDEQLVAELKEKIKENDYHCLTKNSICPCEEFLNSTELGLCDCGLYKKTEI